MQIDILITSNIMHEAIKIPQENYWQTFSSIKENQETFFHCLKHMLFQKLCYIIWCLVVACQTIDSRCPLHRHIEYRCNKHS